MNITFTNFLVILLRACLLSPAIYFECFHVSCQSNKSFRKTVRGTLGLTKEIKLGVPGKTKSLFTHLLFLIYLSLVYNVIYVIVGGILLGTAQKVNKIATMILFSNHVYRNTLNQNMKNKSKRYIKNTNLAS